MKLAIRSTLFVVILTVILGGVYPAAVTGVSRLLWPTQAAGSFVSEGGRVVGSELIGQSFSGEQYLRSRPSGAGKDGYDGVSSSGRNKGPIDAGLAKAVQEAVATARADRPGEPGPVPADLVTASASGLDPHLSPDAANWQAGRIARARGVSEKDIRSVIARHVEPRTLWILGEPRVNVLLTNLDLDRSFPDRP